MKTNELLTILSDMEKTLPLKQRKGIALNDYINGTDAEDASNRHANTYAEHLEILDAIDEYENENGKSNFGFFKMNFDDRLSDAVQAVMEGYDAEEALKLYAENVDEYLMIRSAIYDALERESEDEIDFWGSDDEIDFYETEGLLYAF